MACTVEAILNQARSWIGKNEKDGSFMPIIDVYNSHKPLARGYKMTYKDAWCATFISALAIKLSATDIIPTECGCERQIELFKALGSWIEDESITPEAGDIIYYDWQDTGAGDNKGWSDHVGIVEKVVNGVITTIEGNSSDMVKRKTLAVNARYIRGFARPKYIGAEVKPVEVPKSVEPVVDMPKIESKPNYYVICQGDTLSKIARQFGTTVEELVRLNGIANPNRIYAGQKLVIKPNLSTGKVPYALYKVATNGGKLNIRSGAGTNYPVIGEYVNGTEIKVSGETVGDWVKLADRTGYVSIKWIKKV